MSALYSAEVLTHHFSQGTNQIVLIQFKESSNRIFKPDKSNSYTFRAKVNLRGLIKVIGYSFSYSYKLLSNLS